MWGLILLAGGSGSRMGADKNKVLLPLAGKPVILRSADAFAEFVDVCVLVCRPEDKEEIQSIMAGSAIPADKIRYADGGEDRQGSVWNGLRKLPTYIDKVMIHDGARCMVDADTIRSVMTSVDECGTGVAAIPATDTIKTVDAKNLVTGTPDRSTLRVVQTPQGFWTSLILWAHRAANAAGYRGTDDASLLEFAGMDVQLTTGSRSNIKLTTPEDMQMALSMLQNDLPSLRVGQGYDVHRLV